MLENIDPELTAEAAADYFGKGYHCAEAVVAACLEAAGEDAGAAISHATAFGGGFGKTFMETCGVLSGSMIIIGHYFGRQQPGGSWDIPADIGAVVRQKFVDKYRTSNCGILRDRFGEEKQMDMCRELVRQAVIDLVSYLQSEECSQIVRAHKEGS